MHHGSHLKREEETQREANFIPSALRKKWDGGSQERGSKGRLHNTTRLSGAKSNLRPPGVQERSKGEDMGPLRHACHRSARAVGCSAKQFLSLGLQRQRRHNDHASIQRVIKLCSITLMLFGSSYCGTDCVRRAGTSRGKRQRLRPQGNRTL